MLKLTTKIMEIKYSNIKKIFIIIILYLYLRICLTQKLLKKSQFLEMKELQMKPW